MPEETCKFCNIDTTRNRILLDGARSFVILSNPRLMPAHLLVIPKRHVSSLAQLTPGEFTEIFRSASYAQEAIKKFFSELWGERAGCDLSQHDRPFMPTTRLTMPEHLHIHLRPRRWKDDYYQKVLIHETDFFQELEGEELEQECERLKGLLLIGQA